MSAYGADACRWCGWWTDDERDLKIHICSAADLRESIDSLRAEKDALAQLLTEIPDWDWTRGQLEDWQSRVRVAMGKS